MKSIIVIGGGVIGSSIAFNLLQDGFQGNVTVMERDSSYQFASSALAFGGVRQQFMSSVNVRMVQYSLGVIAGFPKCEFRQRGYLFLGNASNWAILQRRYEVQKSLGAECELLSVDDIRRLVPELRTDDLLGGLFGPKDGYVDPRATLRAFRNRAEQLGATYVSDEVRTFESGPIYVIASGAYSGTVPGRSGWTFRFRRFVSSFFAAHCRERGRTSSRLSSIREACIGEVIPTMRSSSQRRMPMNPRVFGLAAIWTGFTAN